MKIVFMGTPKIAADVLRKMVEGGYAPELVVTQPDRGKNRGKKKLPSEVKELAIDFGIPVTQPEQIRNNQEFLEELQSFNPDIAVVVAYGKILPKEILDIPTHGCLNIHASLLPKFRGASPIQAAILAGEEKTGVTIIQMDEGMDTGDMLLKEELDIGAMNAEELSNELGNLGGELILQALSKIEDEDILPEKQDDNLATYTNMIKKDDGRICIADFAAEEIERMVRAYYPWPGVSVFYKGKPIKLCKVSIPSKTKNENVRTENINIEKTPKPGGVVKTTEQGIFVATRDGIILIEELQLPGKNIVKAGDFLRGHKVNIDSFV